MGPAFIGSKRDSVISEFCFDCSSKLSTLWLCFFQNLLLRLGSQNILVRVFAKGVIATRHKKEVLKATLSLRSNYKAKEKKCRAT
jgi:hypothetical protein